MTRGWNSAYKLFLESPQYEALFVVNNDIIFPPGAFTRMADVLRAIPGPAVVGPMTTKRGLGAVSSVHAAAQNVELAANVPRHLLAGLPGTTSEVDDFVSQQSLPPHHIRTQWLLGYVTAVDRDIQPAGYSAVRGLVPPPLVCGLLVRVVSCGCCALCDADGAV